MLGSLSSKTAFGDMDCRRTLIKIYLFICKRSGRIEALTQRQSNNSRPDFTDEKVLAVYLFGLLRKRRSVSEIYQYVRDHFAEWFPELPSYQGYTGRRLNRMSAVFVPLARVALSEVDCSATRKEAIRIADSMPIMFAKQKRSSCAKVASRLVNKDYRSSKNTRFYGAGDARCRGASERAGAPLGGRWRRGQHAPGGTVSGRGQTRPGLFSPPRRV